MIDDFTSVGQVSLKCAAHRGEDDIVDRPPEGVADRVDLRQVGPHDAEPAAGPDGAIQRTAGRPGSGPWPEFGQSISQTGWDAPKVSECVDPAYGCVHRQPPRRWLRPGEVLLRSIDGSVDQAGKDRQAAHSVSQHMVEDDDQSAASPASPVTIVADHSGWPVGSGKVTTPAAARSSASSSPGGEQATW